MIDISTKIGELQSSINGLAKRLQTLETQDKVGNFTAGSVLFASTDGSVTQDNSNFYWDDTNNRLGLGVTVPSGYVHINFTGGSKVGLQIQDNIPSADTLINLINPDNTIAGGSYFIRAIKGSTDQFYVRGDGSVLTGGTGAGFVFQDRTSSQNWQWYGTGAAARLHNGTSDVFSMTTAGVASVSSSYQIAGTQVVTSRRTGWAAATNTKLRTTFDTTTVTLPQLAARVGALLDDLISHGLIGS